MDIIVGMSCLSGLGMIAYSIVKDSLELYVFGAALTIVCGTWLSWWG